MKGRRSSICRKYWNVMSPKQQKKMGLTSGSRVRELEWQNPKKNRPQKIVLKSDRDEEHGCRSGEGGLPARGDRKEHLQSMEGGNSKEKKTREEGGRPEVDVE